ALRRRRRYDSPMRLHSARVPQIAAEMVSSLVEGGDIETASKPEVQADVESVLNQYIRDEQDVTDQARQLLASRSMPASELSRMRRLVAEDRGIKIGDDAVDYLLDQLTEMLRHSSSVEEIYAADVDLRRELRAPLRAQAAAEQQLQAEVRGRLKPVQEGTSVW